MQFCAIFVSLELSRSSWLITSLSPGGGEKMSRQGVPAAIRRGLVALFAALKRKADANGRSYPIIAIDERGWTGFGSHRVLRRQGIESHVVDAASIAMPRRRRWAKTTSSMARCWCGRCWPTSAASRGSARWCVRRRPRRMAGGTLRERQTLVAERVRHVNRIKGLLFSQGSATTNRCGATAGALRWSFVAETDGARGSHFKAQIERELTDPIAARTTQSVEVARTRLLARRETASDGRPADRCCCALKESAPTSPPCCGLRRSAGASPTAARSPPMRAWRRRPGGADASIANRACRRPAIRGWGPP